MLRKTLIFIVPAILLIGVNFITQAYFVDRSRGVSYNSATFTEIDHASSRHLLSELAASVAPKVPKDGVILSDAPNLVLGKLSSVFTRNASLDFIAFDYFANLVSIDPALLGKIKRLVAPSTLSSAQKLNDARNSYYQDRGLLYYDRDGNITLNRFNFNTREDLAGGSKNAMLLRTSAAESIFNRWQYGDVSPHVFDMIPTSQAHDHLVFESSDLGKPYFAADRSHVTLFQLEPDPYYAQKTDVGVGQYFLFRVLNPSKKFRLTMDFTNTVKSDGINAVPPVAIIGDRRYPMTVHGRGSARLFSDPIQPQIVDGAAYIMLDMGMAGTRFPIRRHGLMRLYGLDVPLDRRLLVGFVRDISLVSDDQYKALEPPENLKSFPADLSNRELPYSGLYEDGYVSEDSSYVLTQKPGDALFSVRGLLPYIADARFSSLVSLFIDGKLAQTQTVLPGNFELRAPATSPGRHAIRVTFSRSQSLPPPDDRPIGAQLAFIGFESGTASSKSRVEGSDAVTLGDGWYTQETAGGKVFRWARNGAQIELAPSVKPRTVTMVLEPGPGKPLPAGIDVSDVSTGRIVAHASLASEGPVRVELPASPHAPVRLRLHIAGPERPAPGDPRTLDVRAFSIGAT